MTSEILYRKVGRKYVPDYSVQSAYDKDFMKVGTWRMVYAYDEGGRRYEYDVKPDTASFSAACMLARHAMEQAIHEAAKARPQLGTATAYTKKQLKVIEDCRQRMAEAGILMPLHWQHSTAYEISQAAIEAIKNWREA
jgi:hypothetical protein